jgi:hypothetical protein
LKANEWFASRDLSRRRSQVRSVPRHELGLRELAHPLYIENAKIAPMLERLYMGTHPATLGRFGKTDKKTLLWTSPFTILRVCAACPLLQLYRAE